MENIFKRPRDFLAMFKLEYFKKIKQDAFDAIMAKHYLWEKSQKGGEKAEFVNCFFEDIVFPKNINRYIPIIFRSIVFKNCFFRNIDLSERRFFSCSFQGSFIIKTNLSGSNIHDCNLINTDLLDCSVDNIKLRLVQIDGLRSTDFIRSISGNMDSIYVVNNMVMVRDTFSTFDEFETDFREDNKDRADSYLESEIIKVLSWVDILKNRYNVFLKDSRSFKKSNHICFQAWGEQ